MRLQELFETTEEDRALISLGSSIYQYLQKYADVDVDFDNPDDENEGLIRVGKIGHLFDSPIQGLNDVNLELQSDEGIENRLRSEETNSTDVTTIPGAGAPGGIWYNHSKTLVLNLDFLSSNFMKSVVVHELRHMMDDVKSGYKANASIKYSTPKKKEHRKVTNDPYLGNTKYIAEPAEINARFAQVLHGLVSPIHRAVKLDPQNANKLIFDTLNKLMVDHRIQELFPEAEKSKDYQRLMKRAVDFINKEAAHAKTSLPDQPK